MIGELEGVVVSVKEAEAQTLRGGYVLPPELADSMAAASKAMRQLLADHGYRLYLGRMSDDA